MSEEIVDEVNAEVEKPEHWLWPRYFLHISYDGSKYHGWQRQINGHSVQAEIETALGKLLKQEKVITIGCGRTDTGVHADKFYLHFNVENGIPDMADMFFKLSHMLPWDIGVYEIIPVHTKAHARFDAIERSYEYHIHQQRNPFIHAFSTLYTWPLDVDKMNEAAALMLKETDFATFCKAGGGQKTTICDLRRAEWEVKNGHLVFHITADRFLRNMVRAVVGTLVKVGRGQMTVAQFEEVLQSHTRIAAGASFAPQGLHLTEVKYPYLDYSVNEQGVRKSLYNGMVPKGNRLGFDNL